MVFALFGASVGRASREKWQRRAIIDKEVENSLAPHLKKLQTLTSLAKPSLATRIGTFILGAVVAGCVAIPATLMLSPVFARFLSFGHSQSVWAAYSVLRSTNGCNVYVILITPKDLNKVVKAASIHIHFPSEVQSLLYGTDRNVSPGLPPVAIGTNFRVSDTCDVDAPVLGDLPPAIQVKRTGQQRRDVDISAEGLDKESAFVLVVGAQKASDPRLLVSGRATYSSWNQDLPASVEGIWRNPFSSE
jgi:hypothetical protein